MMLPEKDTQCFENELIIRLKQHIPELALVLPYPHSYRYYEPGQEAPGALPVLCLAVPRGTEWKIWLCFQKITAKLLNMCVARKVMICCEGKFFVPNKSRDEAEDMEEAMNGIFQRLLNSHQSGGLVDYASNELIWATPQITETAGRSLLDILTTARSMSCTWDAEEEERRDQALREQALSDYLYSAYAWEKVATTNDLWSPNPSPMWRRVKRNFRARSMSMIEIGGRWFRLTEGVEVVQ